MPSNYIFIYVGGMRVREIYFILTNLDTGQFISCCSLEEAKVFVVGVMCMLLVFFMFLLPAYIGGGVIGMVLC